MKAHYIGVTFELSKKHNSPTELIN